MRTRKMRIYIHAKIHAKRTRRKKMNEVYIESLPLFDLRMFRPGIRFNRINAATLSHIELYT